MKTLAPASIAPPFARYSHGVETPAGVRLVFCSGQLGLGADGSVPDDVGAQARICFSNIAAILADAGMALADIVRVNAYVTERAHMAGYMAVRDEMFSGRTPPASTLMIVAGFTRPEFKVEIEAIAAAK